MAAPTSVLELTDSRTEKQKLGLTPKPESQLSGAEIKRLNLERKEREEQERTTRRWEKNYSNEDSLVGEAPLHVHYCTFCGAYSLILDVKIETLPVRKTDRSFVLEEKKHTHRRTMNPGEAVLIRRDGGIERQYRFHCKDCRLLLAYRTAPADKPSKYTYFVAGALTSNTSAIRRIDDFGQVVPVVADDADVAPDSAEADSSEAAPAFAAGTSSSSSTTTLSSSSSSSSSSSPSDKPSAPAAAPSAPAPAAAAPEPLPVPAAKSSSVWAEYAGMPDPIPEDQLPSDGDDDGKKKKKKRKKDAEDGDKKKKHKKDKSSGAQQ